jgi:UDP-N-acetylglucosamine--N-acetylmuramyl-(pentapeptide) pyrophosphoryl-undecaprenol N-acetylglucosamine transferase
MNVAIACGGTGGHIYPGLATGRELVSRGHEVTLWLSGKAIESEVIVQWSGPVVQIEAAGFTVAPSWSWLRALLKQCNALRESRKKFNQDHPDILLAMGSYASVAPALIARMHGIPVVLHEANAIPGRAISMLARGANRIGVTFQRAARHLPQDKVTWTGLPISHDLSLQLEDNALSADHFTLLVMGGSQGAARLNEIVPEAVIRLHRQKRAVQAIHITGKRDEFDVRNLYTEAGVPHSVHAFYAEMGRLYNASDLAICRSGAATCMELALSELPAVLVPLPASSRDHQYLNALEIELHGGAIVMPQDQLTPDGLFDTIVGYMERPAELRLMRDAMKRAGLPNGAAKLADLMEECYADI